jgi:hypothetical protein
MLQKRGRVDLLIERTMKLYQLFDLYVGVGV